MNQATNAQLSDVELSIRKREHDGGVISTLKNRCSLLMHVDANNVSNVICAFVFECYSFLGGGICELDIAVRLILGKK